MTIAEIKQKYLEMKQTIDKMKNCNGLDSVLIMDDYDFSRFSNYYFDYENNTADSDTSSVDSQDNTIVKIIGENVIMTKNFKSLFPEIFKVDLLNINRDELSLLKNVIETHFVPEACKIREAHEIRMEELERIRREEEIERVRIEQIKYNDQKQRLDKIRQFKLNQDKEEEEIQKKENENMWKYLKSLPKLDRKKYAGIRKLESDKLYFSRRERQEDNTMIIRKICKEAGVNFYSI
jgi:hypothetical protein